MLRRLPVPTALCGPMPCPSGSCVDLLSNSCTSTASRLQAIPGPARDAQAVRYIARILGVGRH
jgi:hypothetical protein